MKRIEDFNFDAPPLSRRRGKRTSPGVAIADLVKWNFIRTETNQVWVPEITEHPAREGKLVCCITLDTFSRRIVGWAIDCQTGAGLATDALSMAINAREPNSAADIHGDHGPQGGFNWSSQHLEVVEVFVDGDGRLEQEDQRCSRGCATAVACGSGVTPADAFARFAYAVAGGAAAVLVFDRFGYQLS